MQTPWTRKEVVDSLERLVARGMLIKVGETYRRADRTCCRLITIDDTTELMAIVEFFENTTAIEYRFMLAPQFCNTYNGLVSKAIQRELDEKFSRGILSVWQIAAVSAFGRITLWTYDPHSRMSGLFGQWGTH